MPTSEPRPSNGERKKWSNKKKGIVFGPLAAAAAAAIILPIAVGATSNNGAPSPSPRPTESSEPNEPGNEASFTALDKLSPSEFFNQDISKRAEWCLYMNQDLPQIAKDWKAQSGNDLDTLPTGSGPKTAQEKVQLNVWMERMAFVSHENASLVFTKEQAYKMISCTFIDVNSGSGQAALAAVDEAYKPENNGFGFPGAYYAQQGLLQMSEVASSEDEVTLENGETSQLITLGGGSTHEYVSVHTTDPKGNDAVIYAVK